jgi:hypothetical protein
MTRILPPSQPGSVSGNDITQGEFRSQIAAIASTLTQLTGYADPNSGDSAEALLTSPYQLYVNPVTGRDSYVAGIDNVNTTPNKLTQQAVCGYTPFTPFRSLSRALLEAARISVILGPENDLYDRVVIHCSAGTHYIDNRLSDTLVDDWGPQRLNPTAAQLRAFNSNVTPGLILPRGVSIIGEDLRKTVIRPLYVPSVEGGFNPITDRAAIFRVTGGSFFFNFTFKDGVTDAGVPIQASHHLLSCFEFCDLDDLQRYYDNIERAFKTAKPEVINPGETEIVAPPTPASLKTDSTKNSSPYIFNCSLRSDWGLCGAFLDGSKVTGFRSMVAAQFTNVSLQTDLRAWECYDNNNWIPIIDYDSYIKNVDINNLRTTISGSKNWVTGTYDVDWRSFGFKCINNAIIQEVSCFVIGDSIHHWTASGGEATITNSNSNFGQTAFLSDGYRGVGTPGGALPQDQGFLMDRLRRPRAIAQDGSNIRRIILGSVKSYDPTTGTITLNSGGGNLDERLAAQGYSLTGTGGGIDNYIWISNTSRLVGPGAKPTDIAGSVAIDVRAPLSAAPYNPSKPDEIVVKLNANNNINTLLNPLYPEEIVNNQVYLRRIVDTRSPIEREYSLTLRNTNLLASRRPVGNYILRLGSRNTTQGQLDPTITRDRIYLVTETAIAEVPTDLEATNYFRVVLRAGDSAPQASGRVPFSRLGYPIEYDGRIKRCKKATVSGDYNNGDWENALNMLPSINGVEYPRSGIAPKVVLDKDLSPFPDATNPNQPYNLGIDFLTDSDLINQITSSTDYIALRNLLIVLGYNTNNVGPTVNSPTFRDKILAPQNTFDACFWNPSKSQYTPNGLLKKSESWPVEFNRPSLIRGYGHAYEWVGYSNYSKSLPVNQQTSLTDQAIIDFLAVNLGGGRVYNTGFTEEGLLVQGDTVRDLGTNRDLSIEAAGLGGLSGDPEFQNLIPSRLESLEVTDQLTVEGTTTIRNLDINGIVSGAATYTNLPQASYTEQGILRFATVAQTETFADELIAVTPSGLIGALGPTFKSLFNARLSLSANSAVPSDSQPESDTIYLHPFSGSEITLYDKSRQRWRYQNFNGILPFSLASCTQPNSNYDIYVYELNGALKLAFVPWLTDTSAPTRTVVDGVLVRQNMPEMRFAGVVRTTAPGKSILDLGGSYGKTTSSTYPRVWLANAYNLYGARATYLFNDSWNSGATTFRSPPGYQSAPRVSFVTAIPALYWADLSILVNRNATGGGIVEVAPGFNNPTIPTGDCLFGRVDARNDQSTMSKMVRTVNSQLHEVFYLYKSFQFTGSVGPTINADPQHGMIVICQV